MEKIKVSVRNLVEFVLTSGDLKSEFTGVSRNIEGIRAHQFIEKSSREEYSAEVPVSYTIEKDDISLEVKGRMDGVIKKDGKIIINEIKSTEEPLQNIDENYNRLHFAQAEVYSYIYCMQNNMKDIVIRLTYFNLDTKKIKDIEKKYSLEKLEEIFYSLINEYIKWAKKIIEWHKVRDASIESINFPFSSYREGQRKLAAAVYTDIKEGNKLFIKAPTGIGKTMAVIFPAVKSIKEGLCEKIFYLTGRNTQGKAAEDAVKRMREEGLRLKSITLTAKEKICFKEKKECSPDECEYAKGYYDRVKKAVLHITDTDFLSRDEIEKYAKKYTICPFEFSLFLCSFSDLIICDYNYAFDPRACLKQFFVENEKNSYVLLIDEAHNLADRSRDMYSSELLKGDFLKLKNSIKSKLPDVKKSLNKINSYFIKLRKECEDNHDSRVVKKEGPKDMIPLLHSFCEKCEKYLKENKNDEFKDELLDTYFNSIAFTRIYEYYGENYVTYYEKEGNDVRIKLFCIDPSSLLKNTYKHVSAAVLFSATLNPLEYYIRMLGGDEKSYKLSLDSPFPRENFCMAIDKSISTRYKDRERSYDVIADSILKVVKLKKGNYLVFFPSYKYMAEVYEKFKCESDSIDTVIQRGEMNEDERREFLESFSERKDRTLVGFAVMGGVFGEGIDLSGDKLSGAFIIGVGLPKICLERNIIQDYFEKKYNAGFFYAYVIPGMNKVMQAVGRVIRTENDRGIAYLIDERFVNRSYRNLFPKEWDGFHIINKVQSAENIIRNFWDNK